MISSEKNNVTQTTLYTIGHSTRTIELFLDMLANFSIELLVDVRTVPRSRRHPQFSQEILQSTLREAGIAYEHCPELGGLRKPSPDSVNTGWRNDSFRGYADHMQSPGFAAAMQSLHDKCELERVAVMCAEAVPWKCHRFLISDAATLLWKMRVEHIMSATASQVHAPSRFARVDSGSVMYPADTLQEELTFE